jgi:hypothetical protein
MRKDVECTFGILKGRWHILKAGICVHGIDIADKIWLTCCVLHNMLLDVDSLDEHWSAGIPSDWAGDLGRFDGDDTYLATNLIPMAIQCLNDPDAIRNYDTSKRTPGAATHAPPSTYARCKLVGVSIMLEGFTSILHLLYVLGVGGARGRSSLILLFHCTNGSDRTGHVD